MKCPNPKCGFGRYKFADKKQKIGLSKKFSRETNKKICTRCGHKED